MKQAMFWKSGDAGVAHCHLCYHRCRIAPGRRGICSVRENREGKLISLVYGHPITLAVDPIEKKPLYHLLPGTTSLSTGTRGCNFHCLHCQNCDISQVQATAPLDTGREVPPEDLVQAAVTQRCHSISYTYTEPTIFFEYAFDCARLAAAKGLKNIFVSNGYITPDPLRHIAPYLDAANLDLKFISDNHYKTICGGRLQPVLDSIRLYHELGIWIELTTLIIPTYNDAEDDLRRIAEFIAALDPAIPWHVTAFRPTYKLTDAPATPLSTLRTARQIGLDTGLQYVYTGNLPDADGSTTRCPHCNAILIQRRGFDGATTRLKQGACPDCTTPIPGIWA